MTVGECLYEPKCQTLGAEDVAGIACPMPGAAEKLLDFCDRHRVILLAVLAGVLLLGVNGQWQVEPDSALYLVVARNISLGRGYVYHGSVHHLIYPGLPYVMAGLFRIFPGREIAACNGLIVGCELVCLGAVYRLFLLSCGRPTAVLMTVLTGIAHESFRYCFEIMPEIPFLAGIMLVLAGFEGIFKKRSVTRWCDWLLLAAGVLMVVNLKPMMLPLLVLCVVVMPWRVRELRRRSYVAAGIIMAFLILFIVYDPRHPFSTAGAASYEQVGLREMERFPSRWRAVLVRNLADLLGSSVTRAVIGVPAGITAVNVMVGICAVAATVWLAADRPLWGLWAAMVIAKLTFLYSHDRYLVPILPLLIFGWWRFMCGVCRKIPGKRGNGLFVLMMCGMVIPNLVKAGSTVVDQHRHPFLVYYHGGRSMAMNAIGRELREMAAPEDVILAPGGTSRVLTFFSDRNVFEPGDRVDLSGHRVLLVVPVQVEDPEFLKWNDGLRIGRRLPAMYMYDWPVSGGGSFGIFVGVKEGE